MNRTKARPHPRPIPPPLRGSGTKNYVAKFTSLTTLGNSQIFDNGTNVGVSTANPTDKLDVRGNIKLGGSGALFGPGGVENLLILRGQVNQDGSSWGQIGFSVSKPATGQYVVTLKTSPPFPGSCLAVVTPVSEISERLLKYFFGSWADRLLWNSNSCSSNPRHLRFCALGLPSAVFVTVYRCVHAFCLLPDLSFS